MYHGKKLGDICFKFFFFVSRPPKNDPKIAENSKILSVSLNFAPLKTRDL